MHIPSDEIFMNQCDHKEVWKESFFVVVYAAVMPAQTNSTDILKNVKS
jgi:hypothetical protein